MLCLADDRKQESLDGPALSVSRRRDRAFMSTNPVWSIAEKGPSPAVPVK